MSGLVVGGAAQDHACRCPEAKKPMRERRWVTRQPVFAKNAHVFCEACGAQWATYGRFVRQLRSFELYREYVLHLVHHMVSLELLDRPDAEQRLLSIGIDWEGRRCIWHNVKHGESWATCREVPGAKLYARMLERSSAGQKWVAWMERQDGTLTLSPEADYPGEVSAQSAADALEAVHRPALELIDWDAQRGLFEQDESTCNTAGGCWV